MTLAARALRAALSLAAFAALGLVALGFAGSLSGAFDSLAHFRAHLAAVAAAAGLLLLLSRRGRPAGAAAIVAAGAAFATVLPYVAAHAPGTEGDGPTFALLQMNLRYDADIAPALERIAALAPDVVTMQEVTDRAWARLGALSGYPGRLRCEPTGGGDGTALLSRSAFVAPGWCAPDGGTVIARVDLGGTAVSVVAEHLSWPWPRGQAADVARLAPALSALPPPVVIGGDFNAAPWSHNVQAFAAASGTRPVTGIGFTWPHFVIPHALTPWVGLPLDNVLLSEGVTPVDVRRAAPTGSDHVPVFVRFRLPPLAADPARPVAAATL